MRLWLPYFIVLIGTYLFLMATDYTPADTNHFFVRPRSLTLSLFASLTFSHDIVFGTFPRLFPPGWFVETQLQFYFIGPSLWILYLKIAVGKLRLGIALSFLIACSVISLLVATDELSRLRYSIIAFMPYFWAGAFFADLRLSLKDNRWEGVLCRGSQIGWCGLIAFIVLGFDNALLQLAARIFCLAIIFRVSLIEGTSFQRALINRWIIRIGTASYSIYLVHLQVLQVVIPVVVRMFNHMPILPMIVLCSIFGVFAVMVTSLVFYWLVERPWAAATQLMSK